MLPPIPSIAEKLRAWEADTAPGLLVDHTDEALAGPPNWSKYPDDHPGCDLLIAGMRRVARTHGVAGHDCQLCAELRRQTT